MSQYSILKSIIYKSLDINLDGSVGNLISLFKSLQNSGTFVIKTIDIILKTVDVHISSLPKIVIGTQGSYDDIALQYSMTSHSSQLRNDLDIPLSEIKTLLQNTEVFLHIRSNADYSYIVNVYITGYYEDSNDNI